MEKLQRQDKHFQDIKLNFISNKLVLIKKKVFSLVYLENSVFGGEIVKYAFNRKVLGAD